MLRAKILFLVLLAGFISGCGGGEQPDNAAELQAKLAASAKAQKALNDQIKQLQGKANLTDAEKAKLAKALADKADLEGKLTKAENDVIALQGQVQSAEAAAIQAKAAVTDAEGKQKQAASALQALVDGGETDPVKLAAATKAVEDANLLVANAKSDLAKRDTEIADLKKKLESGEGIDIDKILAARKKLADERLAKAQEDADKATDAQKVEADKILKAAKDASDKLAQEMADRLAEEEAIAARQRRAKEIADALANETALDNEKDLNKKVDGFVAMQIEAATDATEKADALGKANRAVTAANKALTAIDADIAGYPGVVTAIKGAITSAEAEVTAKTQAYNEAMSEKITVTSLRYKREARQAAASKAKTDAEKLVEKLKADLVIAEKNVAENTADKLKAEREAVKAKAVEQQEVAAKLDQKAQDRLTAINTKLAAAKLEKANAQTASTQAQLDGRKAQIETIFRTELTDLLKNTNSADWAGFKAERDALVNKIYALSQLNNIKEFTDIGSTIEGLQAHWAPYYNTNLAKRSNGLTNHQHLAQVVEPAKEFFFGKSHAFKDLSLTNKALIVNLKDSVMAYVTKLRDEIKTPDGLRFSDAAKLTYDTDRKQFFKSDAPGVPVNIFSGEFSKDLAAAMHANGTPIGDQAKIQAEFDAVMVAKMAIVPNVKAAIADRLEAKDNIPAALADSVIDIISGRFMMNLFANDFDLQLTAAALQKATIDIGKAFLLKVVK